MRAPAAGLSYIEVMVALVLLAICTLPAADAIRSGLRATEAGAVQARELRCVKNTMETVAAESYDNLWKAIQGPTTPSSYSLAADPALTVNAASVTSIFPNTYTTTAPPPAKYWKPATRPRIPCCS